MDDTFRLLGTSAPARAPRSPTTAPTSTPATSRSLGSHSVATSTPASPSSRVSTSSHTTANTNTTSPANSSSSLHLRQHPIPYYSLYPAAGRHDLISSITNVFPPRAPYPHLYPARIADAPDVRDDLTPRPPLRKKPKLSSHPSDSKPGPAPIPGMRKLVGLSKTSSVPSFHLSRDPNPDENRPSSSSGIALPPDPLQQTESRPLHRAPSQKKPLASHSSYGVDTTCGPPPSYSTQRTLSQDRVRLDRNPGPRASNSSSRDSSPSKVNDSSQDLYPTREEPSPVKQDVTASSSTESFTDHSNCQDASSPETETGQGPLTPDTSLSQGLATPTDLVDMPDKGNTEAQLLKPTTSEEESKGSSSDEKRSEDLFLNIAKSDASRMEQAQSKLDKRRSRISLPFFSSTRPSTGYKSSPLQERFDTSSVSGRSEALNYYSKRASLGQHVPGALSRGYTQDSSTRDGAVGTVGEVQSLHPGDFPRRAMSRRYSNTNSNTNTNTEPVRTFSRPSTARNSRLVSDSAFLDRPRMPDHNATESTISTTAPSTVWDELDDLKSRIRKLELTGKLPPSSAAAMTTDRPKTATTAATTLSSSPKHKPAATQLQSAIEGIPSSIHPNLHEALGNAKAVVSNEVYQKLQATAQDALQLSLMMNPEGFSTVGSTIGTSALSERQVRRRTESMCRSLTELAIAILADSKSAPQPNTRPGSRDAYQPSSGGLRSRRYSNDPNDRPPVTSRVQSRLETRRTSIPLGDTSSAQATSPENTYQTPPTALPQMPSTSSSSRLGRTSTLMRSRRTPGYLDGTTDDEEGSPSIRPVSRAMTEVGTYRQAARDRAAYSREYTAQHPMPPSALPSSLDRSNKATTRSQLPANISTHLVPRRKYATPPTANSSHVSGVEKAPVTPKEAWGRISIVPAAAASSPIESNTPDSQMATRPSNTRRSLGFTSRISSVSSRLRAAKAERSIGVRDTSEVRGPREIASSGVELENGVPLDRQGSGQSLGA